MTQYLKTFCHPLFYCFASFLNTISWSRYHHAIIRKSNQGALDTEQRFELTSDAFCFSIVCQFQIGNLPMNCCHFTIYLSINRFVELVFSDFSFRSISSRHIYNAKRTDTKSRQERIQIEFSESENNPP